MDINEIKLCMEKTDIPDMPSNPPFIVVITFSNNRIGVEERAMGKMAEPANGYRGCSFSINREDIYLVCVKLRPDIPIDLLTPLDANQECSTISIRHRDPREIMPYHTTTFSSAVSYGIKVFARVLKENLQVADIRDDSECF